VISSPWLTPAHPDPRGFFLQLVGRALKPLLSNGQKYAVWWDWASILQPADHPLIDLYASEKQQQKAAIQGLPTLYAHPYLTVLQLTTFPPDYPEGKTDEGKPLWDLPTASNTSPYFSRGWCYTEMLWASWPCKRCLDLGRLDKSNESPDDRRSLYRLCEADPRQVPILSEEYKVKLDGCALLNPKEDGPLLIEMYTSAFEAFFSTVRKLDYSSLGWGDDEVVHLCEVLSSGMLNRLEFLHLSSNNISKAGMAALAKVVASGALPACMTIAVEGNPGDATAVFDALKVRVQLAKDAQMQKMWPALS